LHIHAFKILSCIIYNTVTTILLLSSGAVAQVKAYVHIIWKYDGNNYVQVPGALEHIAVGADGSVWGLNSNTYTDNIYKWDGNNFQQFPGALEHIAVGADGSVWGLDSGGLIYKYDGNNFVKVPVVADQISVGNKDNVWGVVTPSS
jgi:virginiamycin B lyase